MDIDKEKVLQWINTHWTGPRNCQVCHSTNWLLLDKVWELREFQGGALVIGSNPVLPVVALMCNVCGHTIFFNAIAVGAVAKSTPREEQDEQ